MFSMSMDDNMLMSQYSNMAGGNSAAENSPMPCCDEVVQAAMSCAFLVPQYAYVGLSGGNERVGYSTPLIQTIFTESLAPPPKV